MIKSASSSCALAGLTENDDNSGNIISTTAKIPIALELEFLIGPTFLIKKTRPYKDFDIEKIRRCFKTINSRKISKAAIIVIVVTALAVACFLSMGGKEKSQQVLETTTIASPSPVENEPAYVYLTCTSNPAHMINVNWRTDENYVGGVRYDTEPRGGEADAYDNIAGGTGGMTTSKFEGYIHRVELSGLEPYTTYYFICGSPDHGWSEELSFRTAPAKRENIRFVVGGDSRWDARDPYPEWPSARDNISKLMASYNPDFVIFIGDYLWKGQTQIDPDTWDNWLGAAFNYWRTDDNRLITMIPVIGNHELYDPYPQPSEYDPEEDASNYYMLFAPPGGGAHYSLDWGPDLHIMILDSEILDKSSDSWDEQMEWLEQDLNEHRKCLWKVAADHRPSLDDYGLRSEWTTEFDTYHLDLMFSGHQHYYERSHPINLLYNQNLLSSESFESPENGTIYIVSGGWGAPNYEADPHWYSAQGPIKDYHFTVFDIYENGMLHLKAVNFENEVIDEFTIQKSVPTPSGGETLILLAAMVVVVICCAVAIFLYIRR
jgi:hypothetical protein